MACNECHVTPRYFHKHCTCTRANIMAGIERELRIDDLSRPLVAIYVRPKDFKTTSAFIQTVTSGIPV